MSSKTPSDILAHLEAEETQLYVAIAKSKASLETLEARLKVVSAAREGAQAIINASKEPDVGQPE